MRPGLFALCMLCLVARLAGAEDATADRILTGGRILTVDPEDRIAEALAIRKGRIVAVGTTEEIERLAGPATERIDLRGRTATPGLIDAHLHFTQGGLLRLTTSGAQLPAGEEHRGRRECGCSAQRRGEARRMDPRPRLGRGQVDRAPADRRRRTSIHRPREHPAWLVHTTGHYGVANAAALAIAGITRETKDPPGGVIDRDAGGNPTGVLKETAMALVASHVPRATPDQMREGIRTMAGELNRECMTGVKDPGSAAASPTTPRWRWKPGARIATCFGKAR